MHSGRFLAGAILLCAQLLVAAHAEDKTNYDEPGITPGRDYMGQHFAERIDPFSGNLSLQYTDYFVPGNAGFDLAVKRSYNANNANSASGASSPYGRGWDIHFGRVVHPFGKDCVSGGPQSMQLELPDGSRQTFHASSGVASTTVGTDFLTTSFWKGRCDPNGMIVYSPDGTKYEMTEPDATYYHVKRITDRFGNSMSFTYLTLASLGRKVVSGVTATEGRSLTFNYQSDVLTSISDGRIQWPYSISKAADGSTKLDRVTPPAGAAWVYTYNANMGSNAGSYLLHQVTNPFRGVITYSYQYVNFLPGVIGWNPVAAVSQKIADGDVWQYGYTPSCPSNQYDTTTVTQPDNLGQIVYKHYGYCSVAAGDVWKMGLLYQKTIGGIQTETLTWTPQTISGESIVRPGYNKWDAGVYRPLLSKREVTRDSRTYTTQYTFQSGDLSGYGNPSSITETGTATRAKTLSYFNSTANWIIGLVQSNVISNVGTISTPRLSAGQVDHEDRFGVVTNFGYNPDGTLATRTTADGGVTNFSSYSLGVARLEQRPEAVTINRTVDPLGNIASQSDGEFTWGYDYDDIGRIKSVTYPTGTPASVAWNDAGGVTKTFTRTPLIETTEYDHFGRVSQVTRGGITRTFEYDALGRKIFESLPGSTALGITYGYDALGRPKSIRQTSTAVRTFAYSVGSTTVTDERNYATTYNFDRYGDPDEGYVTAIIPPISSARVDIDRNEIGLVKSVTQNGVVRTYHLNSKMFVDQVTDPEVGGLATLGRDAVGNLASRTLAGKLVTYGHDRLSRLTSITGAGVDATTITYYKNGKVKTVDNGAASRLFEYDHNANLQKDTLTVDANTFITTYGYDGIDGLSNITYPMTKGDVNYGPDPLGRPQKALPYLDSVEHYDSGNLKTITFHNGITQSYGEELARQLPSSITASAIQLGLNYSYDDAANVRQIQNTYVPTETRNLDYDGINRLTIANGPWGNGSIDYDGAGNIKKQSLGPNYTIFLNYPNANQLATVTGGVSRSYQYDDGLGNVTRIITGNSTRTFRYDDLSQMTCADCGAANAATYEYDGQGRRVSEDTAAGRTYFVQAPNGDLLFEYSPNGKKWTKNIYLHGKRVASETGSDALATTTSLGASLTTATVGTSITFTATVSPSGATGTVEFLDGQRSLGIVTVSGGRATLSVSDLAAGGSRPISARYSGDANYQQSLGSVTVTINQRVATASLTGVPANSSLGQVLTLQATVTGYVPTGTVEFRDGSTLLGTATLSSGAASFQTSPLTYGPHSFTATYLGDASNTSATTSASSTNVSMGTAGVVVSSSGSPITIGQTVTYTAAVTGVAGVAPTGNVTFLDGTATLGSAVVLSGSASITVTPSVVGAHQITARYEGDTNYGPTTSAVLTEDVQEKNVALASTGATATASSTTSDLYPPSSLINGDRAGLNWGNGGGWKDANINAFPDWVQIDFNGSKTIDRVVVYSLQDVPGTPVEPTDTLTFANYGATAFSVQGWDGGAWITLATVTGNNLVKRSVAFTPFTTERIRVQIDGALSGWSRLTEIEALGVDAAPVPNVALASAGATATASSTTSDLYPPSSLINGDRAGLNWGNGGGWKDADINMFPDWVQIDFNGPKTINRVVVYSLQDVPGTPVEPTDSLTFANYGATAFTVQGWSGSAWITLATVTGNNLVKRTVTFSPFTTQRIRVQIDAALSGWSRLTEIEAFGIDAAAAPNVALASAGATATASSTTSDLYPASSLINGDRAGLNWGNGGGWKDADINTFPDWVQIDFNGSKTIDRVVVYSLQDAFSTPIEPSDTLTFANYGATAFTVQGWDGGVWITLATVTGNNLVKRTVTFAAFTTQRIRVQIDGALSGWSRLTEIEAFAATAPNVALASAGATVTASSTTSDLYPPSSLINGDRAGRNWGNGGGWKDGDLNTFPDWVQIDFSGSKTIDRVVVYSLQDAPSTPIEPTDTLTFANYGATAFTVQGWDGSAWTTLGTVTGNNLVKRAVTFTPFMTQKIRVQIDAALSGWSRLTEIEAWGVLP